MTTMPVDSMPVCAVPGQFIYIPAVPEHRGKVARDSSLGSNLLCLYVVHLVNYLVPFVTIPYLARILNPAAWGNYSFAESTCRYAALLIEYGFALSATREIARRREDPRGRAELLAGVLGSQFCIALAVLSIGAVWACSAEAFHRQAALFTAGACLAIFDGAGLMWYYQGLERIRSIAWVDVLSKSCAVLAIFLLVHRPSDVWKVLALRALAALLTLLLGLTKVYQEIPFLFPRLSWIMEALKRGRTMFLFRSSTALSTASNVIILGLVARPEVVGFYAAGEKISKATIGLLTPITQAFYPRMANVLHCENGQADRFAKLAFALMAGGGVILGVALFLAAPVIVHTFLGKGFEPAIKVLRVLSLLHPVMAINNMLGVQWMLPMGLDHTFNAIVLSGGVLNVALALALPHWLAQLGPAWAVLAAQSFVMTCLVVTLSRKRLLPFLSRRR